MASIRGILNIQSLNELSRRRDVRGTDSEKRRDRASIRKEYIYVLTHRHTRMRPGRPGTVLPTRM